MSGAAAAAASKFLMLRSSASCYSPASAAAAAASSSKISICFLSPPSIISSSSSFFFFFRGNCITNGYNTNTNSCCCCCCCCCSRRRRINNRQYLLLPILVTTHHKPASASASAFACTTTTISRNNSSSSSPTLFSSSSLNPQHHHHYQSESDSPHSHRNRNRNRRVSSSSNLNKDVDEQQLPNQYFQIHPPTPTTTDVWWPELLRLSNALKARGYFDADDITSFSTQHHHHHPDDALIFDLNLDKLPPEFVVAVRACLAFASDHKHALRNLPKEDVGIIVRNGAPAPSSSSTLLFKNTTTINSSFTRLQDFIHGPGTGPGPDHHTNVLLPNERAETVDIMCVLLTHVYDSVIASSEANLETRGLVEPSVRTLLNELTSICEASNFSRPVTRGYRNSGENSRPAEQHFEMKRGDWICEQCSFMNFARNTMCRQCSEARPRGKLTGGEWECPQCDFYNYGRNTVCLRCDCKRPLDTSFRGAPNSNVVSKSPKQAELEARLAENDEKAERWFRKISQLDDKAEQSDPIADVDFPDIMPLRKGVNRFVVSKRKTPLERRLENDQYRKDVSSDGFSDGKSLNQETARKSLDEILGKLSSSSSQVEAERRSQNSQNLEESLPPKVFGKTQPPLNTAVSAESIDNIGSGSSINADALSGVSEGYMTSEKHTAKADAPPSDSSERWSRKVAELDDVTDLASAIPDEEFPEIMPMRKGENRFVISKKKDRSLTSPQYKRRLAMEQANSSNYVPFVPFPPDYFAKKEKSATEASNGDSNSKANGSSNTGASVGNGSGSYIPEDDRPVESTEGQQEQVSASSSENLNATSEESQQLEQNVDGTASGNMRKAFLGKSLEGSAVKPPPDPLDMSEEAKAERWFRRAAQIKDISELSQIPDEDFPEIMPMRKGVNRFVVSKRKTPLERRLTSPEYRRNLPSVRTDRQESGG